MTTETDRSWPSCTPIGTTAATPMVRIERSDRLRISRALDLGAGGLVVPRVESADDVRQALDWMRFPPTGPARRRPRRPRSGLRRGRPRGHRDAQRCRRRRLPDREPGGRRRRGRDRRAAGRRRPVRRPGRPVALARRPWPLRRPGLPRRDRGRRSPRASATARRPGSCSTTARCCRATSSSGSGSSASARTSGSCPPGPAGWSRPPAAAEPAVQPSPPSLFVGDAHRRDPAPGRLPARSGRAARPR